MKKRVARRKTVLDERSVRPGRLPGLSLDDFEEAGYKCPKCDWSTDKTLKSGVQAFRAHSKRHVRDSRAARRNLLFHVVLLLVVAGLQAGKHMLDSSEFPVNAHIAYVATATDIRLFGTIFVIIGTVCLFESWRRFRQTGRRKWSKRHRLLQMVMSVGLLVLAALGSLVDSAVHDYALLISMIVAWGASLLTGHSAGRLRLIVKRGEFVPPGQLKLVQPRDSNGEQKISKLKQALRVQILDGRTLLGSLTSHQLEFLKRLGLEKIHLDPARQAKRLQEERWEQYLQAQKARKKTRGNSLRRG